MDGITHQQTRRTAYQRALKRHDKIDFMLSHLFVLSSSMNIIGPWCDAHEFFSSHTSNKTLTNFACFFTRGRTFKKIFPKLKVVHPPRTTYTVQTRRETGTTRRPTQRAIQAVICVCGRPSPFTVRCPHSQYTIVSVDRLVL